MTKKKNQPYEPEDTGRQAGHIPLSAADDNADSEEDAQKREIERFAAEQDGGGAERCMDVGAAGENPVRPALEKLLADALSGYRDCDHVLVYVVDRLPDTGVEPASVD